MLHKLYSDTHGKSTIILRGEYVGSGNWLYYDYLYEKLEKILNGDVRVKAENRRKLQETIPFLLQSGLGRLEYDHILAQAGFTKKDFVNEEDRAAAARRR